MNHIWIINQSNSTALFYRNYASMEIDPDLVSGLLSALNNFSEVELKAHGISSIDMGGLRWCYLNLREVNLLLIAAGDKDSNSETMRSRLEVIAKMFLANYDLNAEKISSSLVKVDTFQNFSVTLDMLTDQWKQAEKVMGAAAMFDMLGLFQQMFNSFSQIVKYNFFGDKNTQILKEIGEIVPEFQKTPEFQQNPEFDNISFDAITGWSVITLNPIVLDETILKKVLFKICQQLKNILAKHLSKMAMLYSFQKEVFPFLLDQYELLERLTINKQLMTVFLT